MEFPKKIKRTLPPKIISTFVGPPSAWENNGRFQRKLRNQRLESVSRIGLCNLLRKVNCEQMSTQLNFCCRRMMPGQANRDDRHCSKQSGIEVRCSFLLSTPLPLAMTQRLACSQNVTNMNFCQNCARHRTGGITTNQSVVR